MDERFVGFRMTYDACNGKTYEFPPTSIEHVDALDMNMLDFEYAE